MLEENTNPKIFCGKLKNSDKVTSPCEEEYRSLFRQIKDFDEAADGLFMIFSTEFSQLV